MEKAREAFLNKAGEFYDELYEWRKGHEGASFDEIVSEVRPKRRELMGEMLKMLAEQAGKGAVAEGRRCEECGQEMRHKGELKRAVLSSEGESALERIHYYCPHCQSGVFPPGRSAEVRPA